MKSMNDLVNACATIGDWGGYKIYEWYKLFPEERERPCGSICILRPI